MHLSCIKLGSLLCFSVVHSASAHIDALQRLRYLLRYEWVARVGYVNSILRTILYHIYEVRVLCSTMTIC